MYIHACINTYRYYTSMPLADELLKRNTMFTETVIKNRKDLPDTVRDKHFSLQAGETRSYRDGRFLTLAWRTESKNEKLWSVVAHQQDQ